MEKILNTKRIFIISFLVIFISLVFVTKDIVKSTSILKNVDVILSGNKSKVIYIMRDGCYYCDLNSNNVALIKKEYNVDIYSIDIDNLTKQDLNKLLDKLNIDKSNFGTPHMVITANNKAVDHLSGLTTYPELFNFLRNNNIIGDEKLTLNYLTLDAYNETIESEDDVAIAFLASSDQYSLSSHTALNEIAKKYSAEINIFYIDYVFHNKEEFENFESTLKWPFKHDDFNIPTLVIMNNGEIKKYIEGYRSIEDFEEFLKDNKIIK